MGWTEKIRTLSLELLRAGRCERFDEVVDAVIASAECRPHPAFDLTNQNPTNNAANVTSNGAGNHGSGSGAGGNGGGSNSSSSHGNGNGNGSTGKNGMVLSADAEAYLENVDVRIPAVVVEHGVRMVKDVLKDVVAWEDGTALDEGLDHSTSSGHNGHSKGAGTSATGGASGKKLDKEDSGDSSKKNGDVSAVKKTAKKSHPSKNGK